MPNVKIKRNNKWTLAEKELLIRLISSRVHEVECGPSSNTDILLKKNIAWDAIERSFNASDQTSRNAKQKQLRQLWSAMKMNAMNAGKRKGSKNLANDKLSLEVNKILKIARMNLTSKSNNPLPGNGPTTNSDDKSHDYSDDNPTNRSGPSTSRTDLPVTQSAAPPGRLSYVSSPILERATRPSALLSHDLGSGSHGQVADQRPTALGQFNFGAVRANSTPLRVEAVQPTPQTSGSLMTVACNQGMSPQLQQLCEEPPQQAMESQSSIKETFTNSLRTTRTAQLHSVTASPPQSPRPFCIQDSSRVLALQDTRMQCEIRRFQVFSSMEKSLHEKKMQMEEMLVDMAKELHTAELRSNNALFEENIAMGKRLQAREEELLLTRMHAEEVTAKMQRELHDLQMETAKLDLHYAQINKRIIDLKLKQTELELQQLMDKH